MHSHGNVPICVGSCSPFEAAVTVSSREFSPRCGIVVDRQDQNDALILLERAED